MRGQQALMAIVSNDINIVSAKNVKGCYTNERDDAIACRFFYWSRLQEKRYDVAVQNLSREFFISETAITQRIMTRQDFITQLRTKNITRRQLQKKYPFFNWN